MEKNLNDGGVPRSATMKYIKRKFMVIFLRNIIDGWIIIK